MKDGDGNIFGAFGIARDITARKQIESTLVAREQALRTLLENSPDTIARYDLNCRRTYANMAFAALADGGVGALLGKKPSEYPGGKNSEIYEAKLKGVFATGEDDQFELKWKDKEGKKICSHIRLTAERDLSGKVVSALGIGRDITELSESRDELSRKELAKTRFLAAAGHDLRQPLAAANLFIDALMFTAPTPQQEAIIQRLGLSMSTFKGLLDVLLNISKLDAGAIKPEYASIDMLEVFNWLEQDFSSTASDKQLGFRLHFPIKERLAVRSDIGLLKSILMNLVFNAIKFTDQGAILVSARRRGGEVLFQVWDTGTGIPEEYIEHIFDEFYQVNNPQRDRTSGLGLGLPIAKRALALLGEKITCRSRVGRGFVCL
jgi:PAS domain S-box-containing protein